MLNMTIIELQPQSEIMIELSLFRKHFFQNTRKFGNFRFFGKGYVGGLPDSATNIGNFAALETEGLEPPMRPRVNPLPTGGRNHTFFLLHVAIMLLFFFLFFKILSFFFCEKKTIIFISFLYFCSFFA